MNTEGQGADEHIEIDIPIEVGGIDCMGIQFFDRTHTLMVSRTGGKISLERMVAPEQEVTIRCPATGLEADARVLGQTEKVGETYSYIVKFLDEKSHIWDITFPSSGNSGGAISCVLLECSGCKDHEVVYLDHFELELLEANGHLSRSCKRCRDASLWRKSQGPAQELEDVSPAPCFLPIETGAVSLGANCGSRRACAPRASARISSKLERRRVRDFPSPARRSISRAK